MLFTSSLDILEAAKSIECVSELERKIGVGQITDRMDGWTKQVWQSRQYGYSWKEISTRLGITEHQAKMKFRYGLKKTRANYVSILLASSGTIHRAVQGPCAATTGLQRKTALSVKRLE